MRPPLRTNALLPAVLTFMTGASPNSPPSVTQSPDVLAGRRDEARAGGLGVDHADGHDVGDDAGERVARGVAGHGDHVEADRAHARSWPRASRSTARRRRRPWPCAWSSLTGMKAPERPPMDDVAIAPPFLTASLSSASAAVVPGAPTAPGPCLEDLGDGVAHGRRGRQREVDDAHLGAEQLRGLAGDSSPTRVILNVVRLMSSASSMNEASGLAATTSRTTPGPGDADVDAALGLAAAVHRAGHERVVLGHVAEDDELGAADAVVVGGALARRRGARRPCAARRPC